MLIFEILLDWIGHRTARWLLPALSFGRVGADAMLSERTGFNWLGFKRVGDGTLLCCGPLAASLGVVFWLVVLAVVLHAVR